MYEDLFLPPQRCFTPPSWGRTCNINAICTSLKSTFSGLQFRCWQYRTRWTDFIRLAVIAQLPPKHEKCRKIPRIWPYSSSRSSKVIDFGVNVKPICDFLLVINCNFSRICYRFRDNNAYRKTSNIIRTFLTIKMPGKSPVRIIHRSIFCRFISDWTIVENGKIIDYRNTGGAALV